MRVNTDKHVVVRTWKQRTNTIIDGFISVFISNLCVCVYKQFLNILVIPLKEMFISGVLNLHLRAIPPYEIYS